MGWISTIPVMVGLWRWVAMIGLKKNIRNYRGSQTIVYSCRYIYQKPYLTPRIAESFSTRWKLRPPRHTGVLYNPIFAVSRERIRQYPKPLGCSWGVFFCWWRGWESVQQFSEFQNQCFQWFVVRKMWFDLEKIWSRVYSHWQISSIFIKIHGIFIKPRQHSPGFRRWAPCSAVVMARVGYCGVHEGDYEEEFALDGVTEIRSSTKALTGWHCQAVCKAWHFNLVFIFFNSLISVHFFPSHQQILSINKLVPIVIFYFWNFRPGACGALPGKSHHTKFNFIRVFW